jgi:hypothetical protein
MSEERIIAPPKTPHKWPDSRLPMLATVAAKESRFIARVKVRPDVEIMDVSVSNRERLPEELAMRIRPT